MTSRVHRPDKRVPFQLTTRDRAVLAGVWRHRFLATAHIHRLAFAGSSLRACQARLQRLWAAHLVDRLFLPPEHPDQTDRWRGVPLYSLARRGAGIVAVATGILLADIPHTPGQNRQGYATLRHHLVATDFMVAAETFATATPPWEATAIREEVLRRKLHVARRRCRFEGALVPDGAVTVRHPDLPEPQTYLLEVVRAGVKGGNHAFQRRLVRYRAALRSGFFRTVYGFRWVRTLVVLTPTARRAETLATLSRNVLGLAGFVRFGAYEAPSGGGVPTSTLTPGSLTEERWLTPSGLRVPLIPIVT